MIKAAARNIASKWVKSSIVNKEELEVYAYGCELMISDFISNSILLIAGICMNKVLETIIFLIAFTIIRVVSGGYHASSYRNCIFLFCSSSVLVLIFTNWIVKMGLYSWLFLCLIIADIIILKFAPVETHNRPLEDEEKVKYRRKAILRTVSINAVAILFFVSFPSLTDEISYVFMAVCYAAAFLVAGLHGDLSRARGL